MSNSNDKDRESNSSDESNSGNEYATFTDSDDTNYKSDEENRGFSSENTKDDNENFTFLVPKCDDTKHRCYTESERDKERFASSSEKSDSENDTEHDITKAKVKKIKKQEKGHIGVIEPLFVTEVINENVTAKEADRLKVKIIDKPDDIVDIQTEQEFLETDDISQISDDRTKESGTDNIQEMTDSYMKLRMSAPSEPLSFICNLDRLHTIEKEDISESLSQRNKCNYLLAKAPEYFGYIDDAFDTYKQTLEKIAERELLEKKLADEFWEFMLSGKKRTISPTDVEPVDVTDRSENTISFQPKDMLYDIKNRGLETNSTSTSHYQAKFDKEQNILQNVKIDRMHLPLTASGKPDQIPAYLQDINENDHEAESEFYQFQITTDAEIQPKQRGITHAKFEYFDIPQKYPNTDLFFSEEFIYTSDLGHHSVEKISDDDFNAIKPFITPSASDITIKSLSDDDEIQTQSKEKTKSPKDTSKKILRKILKTRSPKSYAVVKSDLEGLPEIKAHKENLEHATRVPLCKLYEIHAEATTLPVSDERGNEIEVSTSSYYEDIDSWGVSPSKLNRRFSPRFPKSTELSFGEYCKSKDNKEELFGIYLEEMHFTSDRNDDSIEENLLRNQSPPYNKDATLQRYETDAQLSTDKSNQEIDFHNINSEIITFEIPRPLSVTNPDEGNRKLLPNEFASSIVRKIGRNSTYLTQSKSIDGHDFDSSPEMKRKDVLTSIYGKRGKGTVLQRAEKESCASKSDHDKPLSKITDQEICTTETDLDDLAILSKAADEEICAVESVPDQGLFASKTFLSCNNKFEKEKPTTFDPINEEVLGARGFVKFSERGLKNQEQALDVRNFKEGQEMENVLRNGGENYEKRNGVVLEKANPFKVRQEHHSVQQSGYCFSKKSADIEIIEDDKNFVEYSTNDKHLNVEPFIKTEKQLADSPEAIAIKNRKIVVNSSDQDDNFENRKLLNEQYDSPKSDLKDFKVRPSNFMHALKNGMEIKNIARKEAEKIEKCLQANKIRFTRTETSAVTITDNTEDQIIIIEE